MHEGKRSLTAMLLLMVCIGGTDILSALDSIPSISGLTQSTFIVFTATAFPLLGLRQLFFLIDGLLDRLIYLSYGLGAILGIIGIKLVLHVLHENNVPFVNHGSKVPVQISTGLSLGVLVVTAVGRHEFADSAPWDSRWRLPRGRSKSWCVGALDKSRLSRSTSGLPAASAT